VAVRAEVNIMSADGKRLSIVIPVYNEEDNIEPLYRELVEVLRDKQVRPFELCEIIFVDDGSTDATPARLRLLAEQNQAVKVFRLNWNVGQTGALACGFDHARGDVIITLDGDLQSDPQDILRLLDKFAEGYGVVCGWRQDRTDLRRYPTGLANWIVARGTGVPIHDCAFPLKVFRSELLRDLRLYGEMHRYLPIHASRIGAVPLAEVPVSHRRRHSGHSHYGAERIFKLVPDLILIKFRARYATKPFYLFGCCGLLLFVLALACGAACVALWLLAPSSLAQMTLFLLTVMLLLNGCLFVLLGFVADSVMRTYYEAQRKPIYSLKETWGRNECVDSAVGSGGQTRPS
jgi:glycosyltransferase involved in cell wall biosynthesis